MQRLAARIYETIDTLAEGHERRLRAMDGDTAASPEARFEDARSQLALVAQCLESGDGSRLVSTVCEEVQSGAPMASVQRRLSALEQTLIPEVDDMETATFLWSVLAQAREALLQPGLAGHGALGLELTEARTTEQAEPERDELFRSVVENSQAGVFIVDDAYRFVYSNEQLLEIIGYDRREVLGQSFQAFLDDESKQLVTERYIRRQRGEDVPSRYEFNIVRKDGEKRRVEISSAVITDSAGNVRTVAQLTDITERRRLEREIHESLARRGRQIETSAEVAQEIASAPALHELYRRVVTLVKERFGYYHVHLFLVNRARDKLVSVAGYGEIGQQFLDEGYFVPIGTGVVGRAGISGRAVLSSDVREDPDWLYHPLLPDTKGELAVPIILRRWQDGTQREQVLGVLDVQMDRPGVLTEEDQLLLEGLCGQIAIAIESTRLREQTEESLHALEELYRGASREGWEAFQRQVRATAYRYDQTEVMPETYSGLAEPDSGDREDIAWGEEARLALEQGEIVAPAVGRRSAGFAPLAVWGETFGVLGVEVDPRNPLSADDLALLDAVSEQVAQALESARLFDEEQRARQLLDMRVNELDCLNDVGRKIDQALPIEELLRWACERLPAAMQFPDYAIVAVEFEGNLYGTADALESPWQMVHNLQVTGGKGKICIAYTEARQFLNEESALLGDVARRITGYIENRRLFDETQRALQETAVLLRVAEGLGQLEHEEEMFAFVLPQCSTLLGLTQGAVLMVDPGGTTATFKAIMRDGQLVEADRKTPIVAHSPTADVIATGRPVIIQDVQKADLPPTALQTAADLGYRSLLLAPITGTRTPGGKAEVVGAIGVDATESMHEFTEREVALVQAVADQLSVAIENRRLLRSTEAALAESQALYRAASMVAAFESLDSTLQAVADSVAEALAADMVALYRLDLDEERVLGCFQAGPDRELSGALTFEELWAGLSGWVLKKQEPVLSLKDVPDPREDEESRQRRAAHGHGSLIVAPIRYRGKVIGTLTAINRLERDDFSESDVELMMGLANQAAAAIENVRLFDETQRRAEEQARLNEIGRAMAACRDVGSLMAQVYTGVAQLLGVDSLYLALYNAEQDEIEFPLMVLDGQVVESPPALPFGTGGVIDYLIETREPLLLRDRVLERLEELDVTPRLVREGKEPASALGVPIAMGDRALGSILAMDYVEPGAFGEHDRDLLVALSNHAALALQSVRLLEETQAALEEVEAAHRSYLRRGWEEHLRQNRMLAQSTLLYDRGAIHQVYPNIRPGDAQVAPTALDATPVGGDDMQTGSRGRAGQEIETAATGAHAVAAEQDREWATLTVPIILRGQKLGEIGVEVPALPAAVLAGASEGDSEAPSRDWQWTEEDYALLQAVSEQLGQTLESARLFADTQRLAERERLIGEITAKIRASTDMRDILETTAVELGRVLGTSRALVRLTASGAADEAARQDAGNE